MPSVVKELGKASAFENVAGGGDDSDLKLSSQLSSPMDQVVDLLFKIFCEPRNWQVSNMFGFDVLNDCTEGLINCHWDSVLAGQESI